MTNKIMEKVLNKLLFIHYIETLNKKSFISLTSICSDIQQKHPTINLIAPNVGIVWKG